MKKPLRDIYVIFGPPGSGKTVQAGYISKQLKLDYISWGYIYRDRKFEEKYFFDLKIIKDVNTANKIRTQKISSIIDREIAELNNSKKSLIIDGFPRRLTEAKFLLSSAKKHGYKIKALININPSQEIAYERCRRRLVCVKCRKYYDDLMHPKRRGICDDDGGVLTRFGITKKEVHREFLSYREGVTLAVKFLKKVTESSFDVSGDDDEIITFSNILLKLKNKVKSNYKLFERQSNSFLETTYGRFHMFTYQSKIDYAYHLALVRGEVKNKDDVVVRVHSSCITGDIFRSNKCDCGEQLAEALNIISKNGRGILIYLFQEGRGINIINKIRAYKLQNDGLDTVEANEVLGFPSEMRDYVPVKDILEDMHIKSIVLLTNNPDKVNKLTDLGVVVRETRSIEVEPNIHNKKYLLTKKEKMNHKLKKNYKQ